MSQNRRESLEKEIESLKEELQDREESLPAHSIRAHQMQEVIDLEDRIAEKEKELGMLKAE